MKKRIWEESFWVLVKTGGMAAAPTPAPTLGQHGGDICCVGSTRLPELRPQKKQAHPWTAKEFGHTPPLNLYTHTPAAAITFLL